MNKRNFIKSAAFSLAGASALLSLNPVIAAGNKTKGYKKIKHWIWENPDFEESKINQEKRFNKYYDSGIRGVFFEQDSESHFKSAKNAGLETHRWMWTLNRGDKELLKNHPSMYAVSRDGKSCADNPPYVDYYRWLCPSKPETYQYLKSQVEEILKNDYVDGIHLDYVRYCDVILPVNLWDHYNITQHQELPQYDFCYCESCRNLYKQEYGKDPLEIKYVDQSLSWRAFRYRMLNNIVNNLAELVHSKSKKISAAVFPTPEVARRIVRQDWTNWNLDAVFPMIYNGFYSEPVKWIGDAVEEGIHFLNGKFPIYSGLYLADLMNDNDFEIAVKYALDNGASGVSVFGKPSDSQLDILKKSYSLFNK
jgi:hypothetical protein